MNKEQQIQHFRNMADKMEEIILAK